ncbi:MAG: R3H domain-containing nucleic acid-binding protein [bacterium]
MAKIDDELNKLLEVLPPKVKQNLIKHSQINDLIEVVIDLGKPAEARFAKDKIYHVPVEIIGKGDLEFLVSKVGQFSGDNRAGIERTLHRISCMRNRQGKIIGITCRVGRSIIGTIDVVRDVIESGQNTLIMGPPGIGKTTKLREAARVLSDSFHKRVVVVDTSNEIAGDGDIPHPAIGNARRMQVPRPQDQHHVMIEAVENHMPEVIIVDEIGNEQEAAACRTIAERGVQLVGTAHGNSLENIISNPTLSDLVGGIQSVILGDEEAKRRHTQKAVLERKAPPTFDILIEILEMDRFAIYHDVAKAVDAILRGKIPQPEIRVRKGSKIEVHKAPEIMPEPTQAELEQVAVEKGAGPIKIYPFGINRGHLERGLYSLQIPALLSFKLDEADLILTTKSKARLGSKIVLAAEEHKIPIHVIRKNVPAQIMKFLKHYFGVGAAEEPEDVAIREVAEAIDEVMRTGKSIDLEPQNAYVRRQQHQQVKQANLHSESVGEDPQRRIRIYPPAV